MSKPKFIISTTGTSTATNIRRNIFSPPINEKGIKKEIQDSVKNKDVERYGF